MVIRSKKKDHEQKQIDKEVVENFFQLVHLKYKGKIDSENFAKNLKQWSKDKGCYLRTAKFFDVEQKNDYSIDDILEGLKKLTLQDTTEYLSFLTTAISALTKMHNYFLQKVSNIGYNYVGDSIKAISTETVHLMDQIFNVFDYKGTGNIQADRLFFFYLTLLCHQPNPSFQVKQSTFLRDINSSFDCFLKRISCFHGRITCRQFKAYLLFNNLTSIESLELLYKSARFVSELGQQLNEELQRDGEALFPNLLSLAIKRTLPKINLSELRKNSLDLQLLGYFFLAKFFPLSHENNHFQGLCIVKKTALSQLLLKDFVDSYSLNLNTIYWNFHLPQTFLTIIQNYTHIATEVLRYSLTWLLSHKKCPFQKSKANLSPNSVIRNGYMWSEEKLIILKSKPPKHKESTKTNKEEVIKKLPKVPNETKKDQVLTVETEGQLDRTWQTSFLDASPKPSRDVSPKAYETKASPVNKYSSIEIEEKTRRATTTSIMSKKSQSRRETLATSKNFTEENSIRKGSLQEQSVSPATGTTFDLIDEFGSRKMSGKYEPERRKTRGNEEVKLNYRENSETNYNGSELRRSVTPTKHQPIVSKDSSLVDQSVNIMKKEKAKIMLWEEIERMRNENNKAWKYEKMLLENITRNNNKRTPTGSSLERVKEIFQAINAQNQSRVEARFESEESDEDTKLNVSLHRESRAIRELKVRDKSQNVKKCNKNPKRFE